MPSWWEQNQGLWQQPQGHAAMELGGSAPQAAAAPSWVPGAKAGHDVVISGFNTNKIFNNQNAKPGSKYDDPAKVFAESIRQDVGWTRGSDNVNAINFLKANGYQGARMVGDDKVDFGDGQGPIDIFRGSDGALVFQNTTGNPVWEGQQRARQGGGSAAPMTLGSIGQMPQPQPFEAGMPPPMAPPAAPPPIVPPPPMAALAAYAPRTVQGPQAQALRIPGFASGVKNFAGGPAIVGERAPEWLSTAAGSGLVGTQGPQLLNLPAGSDVTPLRLGNGGSYTGGEVAPGGDRPIAFGTGGGEMPTRDPVLGGPPTAALPPSGGGGYAYTSMAAPPAYVPPTLQGPDRLTLGSIGQSALIQADQVGPGAQVTPGLVQPGERVGFDRVAGQTVAAPGQISAERIQGPAALQAQQLRDPGAFRNLSLSEFQADPSYQFDVAQQLGAIQNSAAAKGLLHHPNTLAGIQETAQQLANRQYDTVNARNLALQQQNFGNQATVAGANNAANAQAYGLTNQFQQQAALANQGAALEAGKFNIGTALQAGQFNAGQQQQAALANQQAGLQAGQFNSGQQQQANLANIGNALQAGQFNSAQAQQAALANQGANLQAGQFNANQNFQTQQANLANQLAAYSAYQPLAQQNQQFNAAQQAAAAQNNFANQFSVNQANNAGQLGAFNANLGAELGRGNLGVAQGQLALGNRQADNAYTLGLGNLALGNRQADQSYAIGLGNLGLGQGQLDLSRQGQQYNQDYTTFNTNYGIYRDNRDAQFQQDLARAQLGATAAGNYGNQAGNLYSGQGNANAGAAISRGNAWSGALGQIGNIAGQAGAYYGARSPRGANG